MIAHDSARAANLEILEFTVHAMGIADLRDRAIMTSLGIDTEAAASPWTDAVSEGRTPASWRVRDDLIKLGARGLIDPSRKRPGLWHLCLFSWNVADDPSVRVW